MYAPIQGQGGPAAGHYAANQWANEPAARAQAPGPSFARQQNPNLARPAAWTPVPQASPQIPLDPSTPFGRMQGVLNGRLIGWPQGQTWQTQVRLHGQTNQMTVYGARNGVMALVHQNGAPPEMLNQFDPTPSYRLLFTPSGFPGQPVAVEWGSALNPMNPIHPGSSATLQRRSETIAAAIAQSPYLPVANFPLPANLGEGPGHGLADMPVQPLASPGIAFGEPAVWDEVD